MNAKLLNDQQSPSRDEIIKYLKNKKREFNKKFHIKRIGIFGSFSRGEFHDQSDVDIIYELIDGENFTYSEFLKLEAMLTRKFKRKVELVNYKYMNPIIKFKAQKDILYV